MMITMQSHLQLANRTLHRWLIEPRVHKLLRIAGYLLYGFLLSAASLSHRCLPLAAALVCALPGPQAALAALGSCAGYWLFWQSAGMQGVFWSLLCLLCAFFPGRSLQKLWTPMLLPALSGLITALCGLLYQQWDHPELGMYILRIFAAIGAQLPFSINATVRLLNPRSVRWLINSRIKGKISAL